MEYIFFDVETTGLSKQSDILSLAAIICEDNFDIKDVYNEYFLYGGEVPSGAVAVHGLTSQKLEFLATRDFMTAAPDVYNLFNRKDIKICGHNVDGYDSNVLKYNLEINGYTLPKLETIDTLKMARKHLPGSHKLEACVETIAGILGCPKTFTEKLFRNSEVLMSHVVDDDTKFHSALYDAFCSYCICYLMEELWD